MPLEFPHDYPNDLKPLTTVIIGKARKRFPVQAQIFDLCKYVISRLAPHFCALVWGKVLRADLAQDRMISLIRCLLNANCRDSSERLHLEQETKNSDEWEKLARRLARLTSARASDAKRDIGKKVNHHSEVDSYIRDVLEKTGKRITRTDIWKKVGYKNRTEFERWQRGDDRANNSASERFTQILLNKPHLK